MHDAEGSPLLGHQLGRRILSTLNSFDPQSREAVVLAFMVFYGGAALSAGLAGIVGAYFAGVALEEIYFTKKRPTDSERPVEQFIDDLITGLGPVFFVYAGCIVDPVVFLDSAVCANGLMFTVIAVVGKLACGLVVPRDRWIVGVGMAPRGEVGIVFATLGLERGILTPELFGASMIMILLTTVITPPFLNLLIKRSGQVAPATS